MSEVDYGQFSVDWSTEFLNELVKGGVQHAIISPGSRSTPLVLAAHQIKTLEKRVIVDERSAAFQALGIAKATSKPVLLICTSGTAAANYFPAIAEANLSRVPLIVITADRPPKLRDIGAQQTIDQVKLYGEHAKYVELGEPNQEDFKRLSVLAKQVLFEVSKAKVVHVNAPFRKPLEPTNYQAKELNTYSEEFEILTGEADLNDLIQELSVATKPVFIFGPSILPKQHFKDVFEWAEKHQIPCITESLSQLPVNAGLFEGMLRNKELRTFLVPDLIVRFGRQPVSKSLELYLSEHAEVPHLHFDFLDVWHDATFTTDVHSFGKIDVQKLSAIETLYDESWLELWKNVKQEAIQKRDTILSDESFTDGKVIQTVLTWNTFDGIHLSNSYPVRDIESFGELSGKTVFCNRGANGIDGVLATSMGNSISFQDFCTLIGDVAFLHDMSSLAYHQQYNSNHTIVLINNGGGRIFEMLPISMSAPEVLETYYQTAVPYQAEHICSAFGISHVRVTNSHEFLTSLQVPFSGLRVIECLTDSKKSAEQRRQLLS
ncbi:2-succinyl-5-enolpyruvyl-6-hydroxy-3-cyclohexene-1-carboxylic-acid synthase [bacterium]|nr:MAG: 2-succinyl-5-enolpyruvyl-6-hydroxy-3-cyclohexene-1-carboxylic-acid synthase [bacterium]